MDITQNHAHDIQLLLDYVKYISPDFQIICGTKIYSLGLVFKLKPFFSTGKEYSSEVLHKIDRQLQHL